MSTAHEAREASKQFLTALLARNGSAEGLSPTLRFGLPEIDDRYDIWRISVHNRDGLSVELVFNAITGELDTLKSSSDSRILKGSFILFISR